MSKKSVAVKHWKAYSGARDTLLLRTHCIAARRLAR